MYDFSSAYAAPIKIRFDGTEYDLPRFLHPQFVQWVKERTAAQVDVICKGMRPDERERYLAVTPIAPADISHLHYELLSPHGIAYVISSCGKRAGMTDQAIAALLASGDPLVLRGLANDLSSALETAAELDRQSTADDEKGADVRDPLPGSGSPATGDSGSSPAIGSETAPGTPASSPVETKAG
jgi:hypothetical protein